MHLLWHFAGTTLICGVQHSPGCTGCLQIREASYFGVMVYTAKSWLCILLACLLGIAPLGSAMAEVHSPIPSQHEHAMPDSMSHDAHHSHQAMTAQECEACASAQACDSHDCPCSQCASCITTFLPVLLDIHFETLSQTIPSGEHGLASYLPSLLFRPPRS